MFSHHLSFLKVFLSSLLHTTRCASNCTKFFIILSQYYTLVSILQAWRQLLPKPQNPRGELQCLLAFASFMPFPIEGCFLPVVTALRYSMALLSFLPGQTRILHYISCRLTARFNAAYTGETGKAGVVLVPTPLHPIRE